PLGTRWWQRPPGRGDQGIAIGRGEIERLEEQLKCVLARQSSCPALQITDATRTDAGPLRQLFLRQPGGQSRALQKRTEPGLCQRCPQVRLSPRTCSAAIVGRSRPARNATSKVVRFVQTWRRGSVIGSSARGHRVCLASSARQSRPSLYPSP